jgi:hypothetical protein
MTRSGIKTINPNAIIIRRMKPSVAIDIDVRDADEEGLEAFGGVT